MDRRYLSYLLILLLFTTLFIPAVECKENTNKKQKLRVEKQPFDFVLETLDGKELSLRKLRTKKAIILNFFTTWCPYCERIAPTLNEIYKKYKNKNLLIIGVDYRESEDMVRRFKEAMQIEYPIVIDKDGEVTEKKYGVMGFPTNYGIDKKGRLKYFIIFISPYRVQVVEVNIDKEGRIQFAEEPQIFEIDEFIKRLLQEEKSHKNQKKQNKKK